MPLHKNQDVTLTVDSISSDGNGVGRVDGQAVFIPNAAIGDKLRVKIVKAAKTFAFGRIEQIITPSADRIVPDCPIAGICGGCSFRHMRYDAELRAKEGFVRDALRRIGKLDIEVEPILPSPSENRYRNKMQVPVAAGPDGGLTYGFYALRSHRIVPCEDCLLQSTLLNKIAWRCAALLAQMGAKPYDEATHKGLVRHIYLRESREQGEVMVCIVATGRSLPDTELLVHTLAGEFPVIKTIVINTNPDKTNIILGKESKVLFGEGYINDSLCGVPLQLGPHSFSQVNSEGAERLFGIAAGYASPEAEDVLLDLYCGAGIIGLSMAKDCKELIGVEIVPEAITAARASADKIGLTNTRFIAGDAAEAAKRLAQEGLRPDIITIDPPRKGCDTETLLAIVQMKPKRIVMVSCNPATLARDLRWLADAGYGIQQVRPVDMFPRTRHVECVVMLSRVLSEAGVND